MARGGGGQIEPGDEVGGFVIEAVVGRGGMGVVYRARQARPDRLVALKVIAPDLAADPVFRTRFERESAIAAQIEHPNVIPVYAVGEDEGTLFIAMRLIPGTDLRTLFGTVGRLDPVRAAAIVDQVAQALDAAHGHGLVHRDVKPGNILLAPGGGGRDHVYLTDFGLSRHVEGSEGVTGTGAFLGTIDYVAPEQARGDRVDGRTDVYSLGCVLFHALAGTVPFPLDSDLAKLYAHGTQPPPSIRDRAPDVPAAFDPVLLRAMAKAPDERYASAGELGQAALAAAGGGAGAVGDERAAGAPGGGEARTAAPGSAGTGPPTAGREEEPAPVGDPVEAARSEATVAAGGESRAPGPRGFPRRGRVAILVGVVVIAAVGAAVGLGLTGGGSGGSGGSDGSAQPPSTPGERRLLAMVPATTRPGCVRGTPEPSAEATIACDVASVLTVSYHLFGSRSTADAWYEQSRVAGGVAAETGSCAGDNFHGQVDYKAGGATVGQYFCLLNDHDQPVIVAHDRRVPVDYPAEVFQGTGRPAAENLLRLWTCCIQLQP